MTENLHKGWGCFFWSHMSRGRSVFQVWGQPLATGQECRVLVTIQSKREQVSDTHKRTMKSFGPWCKYPYLLCLCCYLSSGSDSLLDKLQKAAEVVASAVLPPTEHQGIRLYDNHYRAVVTPTAPIEVAVPACSYNLPAGTSKGQTLLWHKYVDLGCLLKEPIQTISLCKQRPSDALDR